MTQKKIPVKTINNETLIGTGNIDISVGEDYGTFTELQTIINNAQNNDTIVLDKDYKNEDDESEISIDKRITIIGNGHIIDANKQSVIFDFSSNGNYSVLDSITFLNGEEEYYNGGAFYGSYITVTNCNFINCKGAYVGGAIDGTHFKIYDSSFINCCVENEDDYDADGGAIYSSQGIEIVNCLFLNNSATGTGASICYNGNDYNQGGVLHTDNSYISNCIFKDNVAQNGYGLYSEYKNVNVYNCTFENTTTHNFTNVDYLTEHQSLKTINSQSLLGNGNIDVSPTIDNDWVSNSTNPVQSKVIKAALDNKLDKTHTSYKGKNVVTNSSTGAIEFEDKNNHTHSQYLTSHQDISGKIDTAGTGLSKSGTTINHSNSITAQTTNALKKIKYDSQGHITGSADVTASDLPTHTHSQYLTEHQSLDSKTVTVEKQSSAESGYAHTYVVKQNGSQVGVKINIPKDFLVKSATVKTVTTANNPVSGYVIGDKYLDFVVNSKDNSATDEHLYVLVSDLVDTEIEWNNIQNKPTLFSGSYADLTNKPSYTPTITSSTNGAYKIGSINISGSNVDIYGKDTDTHQDISGKENISNKTSSWNATTNHTRYPTEKLVKDSLDLKANSADLSTVATTGDYDDLLNTPDELCIVDFYYDSTTDELVLNTCSDQDLANITYKEDKSNKVATWSATPNHIHYPTEKLVKDYIDDMIGDIIDYIEG